MSTDRRSGGERRANSRFHLTPRELEVLRYVLRGDGNKQIAAELGITEQAIKEHVSTLLDKFDVPNRAALAEAGMRLEFSGEPGMDRSWMRELFLHAQPQITVARGRDMRYEAANEAFLEAVGRRPVIGRTMREVFPELDGQGVFEKVQAVYETGLPLVEHEVERRWDRGDGIETRLVDMVVQPLHDMEGRVNGVASFVFDVTEIVEERRRAELIREELIALLELVTSGVVIVDDRGIIVRVNAAASRILRVPLAQGRAFYDEVGHFDVRDAAGTSLPLSERPVTRALRGEDVPPTAFTFASDRSEWRTSVTASVRTLRDPDGRIRGALVIFDQNADDLT